MLAAALLGACGGGSEDQDTNHGYGSQFDRQGLIGLRLRYRPVLQDWEAAAQPVTYERWLQEVLSCTGLQAPAVPFVIVSPTRPVADGQAHTAVLYVLPPLVVIAGVDGGRLRTLSEIKLDFERSVIRYLFVNAGNQSPVFTCAVG